MQTQRPLPQRKTLGTAYNLRPDTERTPARALREGDVVLEGPEHPAVVVRLSFGAKGAGPIRVWARYIWQPPHERPWLFGEFRPTRLLDRAVRGEYPDR